MNLDTQIRAQFATLRSLLAMQRDTSTNVVERFELCQSVKYLRNIEDDWNDSRRSDQSSAECGNHC